MNRVQVAANEPRTAVVVVTEYKRRVRKETGKSLKRLCAAKDYTLIRKSKLLEINGEGDVPKCLISGDANDHAEWTGSGGGVRREGRLQSEICPSRAPPNVEVPDRPV